jgi:hypothetical protein
MTTTLTPSLSRRASWIGGIALLLIAVLAGLGYTGALQPLFTAGDAARTAAAIGDAETQFRLGVLCMVIAAVLDVVVAATLRMLFEPVNRALSATAAWFRVAYAAVFLVAIAQLAAAPTLLDEPARALGAVESFEATWHIGLILFGVHLALVGILAVRSGFMSRVLGALLVIAGAGYIADAVGTILVAGFTPTVARFTFVGEVVLIGWLLLHAVRTPKATTGWWVSI